MVGSLPFFVIDDSEEKLYEEFGVERSVRSILDPLGVGRCSVREPRCYPLR
jgi:hypothetical protein